ncbi:TPA: hypothetical protein ACX6QE_001339 [Photobacterium damselae]
MMAGQETWSMIKRGPLISDTSLPVWARFYAFSAQSCLELGSFVRSKNFVTEPNFHFIPR